jgi:RNA polymerase sigma-70 factor (ECF subfamily)
MAQASIPDDPLLVVAALPAVGFADFYRQQRQAVGRALALTLGDADLATEATDEAMTRAYQHWHRIGGLDNPGGWVYRVGLNWARSVLRRRRRPAIGLYAPGTADLTPMVDPDVHTALAELDVKQRAVVVCRHLFGWSVDETAAALRLRPGTVKSRLHRATQQLQRRLDHHRPEDAS